jgi:predicted Zn-dependent protease
MAKKLAYGLIVILSLTFATCTSTFAQIQTEYEIGLIGPTWDHSTIRVLITPSQNETWWQESYLNVTVNAINQWNEAINHFALNYSDFSYLTRVELAVVISNFTIRGYDAYISWIDQFRNETCEAGLTRTAYQSNVITNATLTLAAHDCRGNVLSAVDMQNVAVHELGHCLGLGHSSYSGDLMYFAYSLSSPIRYISTLDTYGIGVVFRWMAYSNFYDGENQGTPINKVSLPTGTEYQYLPISEENLPPQTTFDQIRTFLEALGQSIIQPENLILIIVLVSLGVVAYLVISYTRRRRPVPRADPNRQFN